MAGDMSKRAATEEVEIQMTPMIDVTFLLLIFFLCSIKFKLLDGKMQTYLPKDVGVNSTPIEDELEKIEV
ncbi:MAG: biopolymer transporter ExbD, partial [Planctomycetota bacterium]